MKQRMLYLYLELKKAMRLMPRMILEAILLMALIGMIAFCGVLFLEKEPLTAGVDIAVVMEEENPVTQFMISYVEGMESVSEYCHFVQASKEDGMRMLEEGKAAALILLPGQLVEGIMNGTNPSVEIYLPAQAGLEAMLFKELTDAGEGLLRMAQAEIYAAYDVAAAYGLQDGLSVMQTEIDSYNLAFALDRLALYKEETVSATGRLSTLQYYAASGIVLFLLLFGMALYPIVQLEPGVFCRQMQRSGVGMFWQGFCQWLCGLAGLCAVAVVGVLAAWLGIAIVGKTDVGIEGASVGLVSGIVSGGLGNSQSIGGFGNQSGLTELVNRILAVLLLLVMTAAFIYLCYSLFAERTTGLLFLFLLSVIMVYASGGIVPSMFLPKAVWAVGEKLPTAYMIRTAGGILTGNFEGGMERCLGGMAVYAAVFGALAFVCRWHRGKAA